MSYSVALSIAFIALFIVYWTLQWRTRFFSTRYYLQIGTLLTLALLALYLLAVALTGEISPLLLIVAVGLVLLFLYHFILFTIKFRESDTRYRRLHKANRAIVQYNVPHQRVTLYTDDGVRIQALDLRQMNETRSNPDKAIIVCHGAGRCKNTLPVVQTCEILGSKYDVFTFDFRGHMESGGTFRGDGDIDLDLKAVIDYVQGMNYRKIAVIGWSIGAWAALLSASRGRKIDAIVAGAPPPFNLNKLSYTRMMERFRLLLMPVMPGVAVVRNLWAARAKHAISIEDFAHQVPSIPILLIYNDFDYVSQVGAEAFEQLYERLPPASDRLRLPGTGHVFDWPNTFSVWIRLLEWLERNF